MTATLIGKKYLKEKAKKVLQSEEGRRIYGCRKPDVEPIFGHMKNCFGIRRTHLWGKNKAATDVGIDVYDHELKQILAKKSSINGLFLIIG